MDVQDFRSLQEAYIGVYERIAHDGSFHRDTPATNLPPKPKLPDHMKHSNFRRPAMTYAERQAKEANKTPEQIEQERKKRQELAKTLLGGNPQKEEVDLYDIILSHLLDEGYAKTPEQAEVIMVNMSEDWRENIIDAYIPWDFGPKQKAKKKFETLAKRKKEELKSGIKGGKGTATRANKIRKVGSEMRRTLDRDSAHTGADPKKQGLQPSTPRHTAAAIRRAQRGMPSSMTARKYYG